MSHRIPPGLDEAGGAAPIEAPRWFAVFTQPKAERRAELALTEALRRRDFHGDLAVWLPVETRWARHARRRERVRRPLFTRYLFVRLREADLHVVKGCDGVDDFVRFGSRPQAVDPGRLEELRRAEAMGVFDLTRRAEAVGPFRAGEAIEVKLGKLSGWPGRVLGMSGEGRVRVLLSMFGKVHVKDLEVREVRAA